MANYREPTAEDGAVFSGLTFGWSVNGRMETFKVVPENQAHMQSGNSDLKKQLQRGCSLLQHLLSFQFMRVHALNLHVSKAGAPASLLECN